MAQSVERRIGSAEVTGSIPVISFHNFQKTSLATKKFFVEKREVIMKEYGLIRRGKATAIVAILMLVCTLIAFYDLSRLQEEKLRRGKQIFAEQGQNAEIVKRTNAKVADLVTSQLKKQVACYVTVSNILKEEIATRALSVEKKEEFVTLASGVKRLVDEDGNVVVEYNGERIVISKPAKNHLTIQSGVFYFGDQKETYYNLDMSAIVRIAHDRDIKGDYWVREDGCKMLGEFIMVAANYDVHPYGSVVETSLGTGIVVDTGGFASYNSTQIDIAVSW